MYRNQLLGPLLFSNLALLGGLCLLPEPNIMPEESEGDETIVLAHPDMI